MREFEERVSGECRRWQLFYDLAAWHAAPIVGSSEKYHRDNPPPKVEDLLGRPMLPQDPRDELVDHDDDEDVDESQDTGEAASVDEETGTRRGRYTAAQMAAMNRGEPVS